MQKNKIIACLIGFVTFLGIQARNQEEIVNSGIKLYDDQKYREAVNVFLTVDENDSSYIRMLGELALTYVALEKYDSAIITCYKSLETPSSYDGHVYSTLATAYDEKGDSENAVRYYKKAIKTIPYRYLNHYNLGYTYYQMGKYRAAADCFQEALRCNPYHSTSHLFMGILAARQSQLTKAMLSLETFLLLEPNSNRSNKYLVYLENIAEGYVDTAYGEPILPFWDNDDFIETDHLIRSRVVLDNDFPAAIDFNISTVKQTQMLLEKLPLEVNSNSFWVETYFPLYKAVKQNAALAPMLYVILRSTNADVVNEWTSKNEKELNDFYKLGSELSYIKYYRVIETDSGLQKLSVNFNDGVLVSEGYVDANNNKQGQWRYFYSYGGTSAIGNYKDNEKDGNWTYFNWNGYVDFEEFKVNGINEGRAVKYHSNGNKRYELEYKNDKPEGKINFYNLSGVLNEIIHYANAVRHGKGAEFYANGDTMTTYEYNQGELAGEYFEYYSNSQKSLDSYYVNGKLDGKYREFFYNGAVRNEGEYKEGLKTGTWNYYFENGNLSYVNIYTDTVINKVISYLRNGNKDYESNYNNKGNLDGALTYYTKNGSILAQEIYEDGKLSKIINYSPDGSVKDEYASPDFNFAYKTYYPEGQLLMEANVQDGKLHGKRVQHWRNGNVKSVQYFDNGVEKNVSETYYQTGAPNEKTFEPDSEGYSNYEQYYMDGALKIKSTSKNNNLIEHYYYFHPNGDLFAKDYYAESKPNGWRTYYASGNQTSYKERFVNGDEVLNIFFDDAGIAYDTLNYDLEKKYVKRSPGGIVEAKASILDYEINDTLNWFYPDGSRLSNTYFCNGRKWGKYTKWYPSGKLNKTGTYANGDNHGLWLEFHENGLVSDSINYIFDDLYGRYVSYYENGKIKYLANYENNLLNGEVICYDINGEPQIQLNYLNDELRSYCEPKVNGWSEKRMIGSGNEKIIAKFPNGKDAYIIQLKDFVPHGNHFRFNKNGSKLIECNYLYGEKDGVFKEYHANGKIKYEIDFSNGKYHGEYKEYYDNGRPKEVAEYYYNDLNGIKTTYNVSGKVQNKAVYFDDRFMRKIPVKQ